MMTVTTEVHRSEEEEKVEFEIFLENLEIVGIFKEWVFAIQPGKRVG